MQEILYKYRKITTCGNFKIVTDYSNKNTQQNIKKINKFEYVNLKTGEIKEFEKKATRKDDLTSIKQTVCKIRNIINANVVNTDKTRFVTLTYKENMKDTKKLYKDFENFKKRLKYNIKDKFEYIAIAEPQERGAWHLHIILIFENKAPYIPNKQLAEIWQNGFVKINEIKKVDNLGAYLSAYLTNIKNGETSKKGARLSLYPNKFNIYRCSKGIKKPLEIWTIPNSKMSDKELSKYKITYENTKEIIINDFTLNIKYYQYKKDYSK